MYDKPCVERFSQLFAWSTVDADDIDDDKYLFAKKFSEVSGPITLCFALLVLTCADNITSGQLPGSEVQPDSSECRHPTLPRISPPSRSEPKSRCFNPSTRHLDEAAQSQGTGSVYSKDAPRRTPARALQFQAGPIREPARGDPRPYADPFDGRHRHNTGASCLPGQLQTL